MSEMHNNGQEQEIATIYCVNCGCGLNEEEGVLASPDWYEDTRFVHYCRDCQQKQFEDFAEDTSPRLCILPMLRGLQSPIHSRMYAKRSI